MSLSRRIGIVASTILFLGGCEGKDLRSEHDSEFIEDVVITGLIYQGAKDVSLGDTAVKVGGGMAVAGTPGITFHIPKTYRIDVRKGEEGRYVQAEYFKGDDDSRFASFFDSLNVGDSGDIYLGALLEVEYADTNSDGNKEPISTRFVDYDSLGFTKK